MIISDLHAPPAGTSLLDCDMQDGQYAFFVDRDGSQLVQFNDWEWSPPQPLSSPVVRLVDKATVVILNRSTRGEANAWLIKRGVGIVGEFTAGDQVTNVLVLAGLIAITYGDEGVFGKVPPSQEGISFFSTDGHFLWGYNTELGSTAGQIWDCYCAAEGPDGRLWFYSYGELPLVGLDCRARTQALLEIPTHLRGPDALSTDGSSFWLFSPYEDQHGIVKWTPGSKSADRVGEFEGRLRGLLGGSFITVSSSGFRFVQVAA